MTSDEERMVICEEEGDDDVMGESVERQSGLLVVRLGDAVSLKKTFERSRSCVIQ